jgi:hypothetical protein
MNHNYLKLLKSILGIGLVIMVLSGCTTPSSQKVAATPSETLLGNYMADGTGGFSYRWLAYVIQPEQGAADQSLFIELNGQRLGPYTNLGQRFEFSDDGEHIAFAVEKNGKWVIVVDGQEKWEYENLGWAYYGWTGDLDGKVIIPQTSSAILKFSPDGTQLAYLVKLSDTEWAYYVNGKAGATYPTVGVGIQFFNDNVFHYAKDSTGQMYVYGDKVFGPYDDLWSVKFSSDGKHFVFAAQKNGEWVFVFDGKEQKLAGEMDSFQIGPAGELFYSTTSVAGVKVYFEGREFTGSYKEIAYPAISPDGKHVAFWASQGGAWSIVIDGKSYPGFDGYYVYKSGDEIYSILWDKKSTNLAYFVRQGKEPALALNGELQSMPKFPGISIQVFVDDAGNNVGVNLMGGPSLDRQAFVECLLQSAQTKCDPVTASLAKGELAYQESNKDSSFMVIGTRKEGPYQGIESALLTSPNHDHYAYIVLTDKGQQVVVDGKLMDWAYEKIYLPQFVGNSGFAYLGKKGGQVFGAFNPYP